MDNVIALIADIIDSRQITDRQVFQRQLKERLSDISERSPKTYLSPLTITLGDEFQAVYADFRAVLPDMLEIISAIHPYQLRIAIAIGPLSTDINPAAAFEMDGPAFNLARELLGKMKKQRKTTIQLTSVGKSRLMHINSTLRLLCNSLSEWKNNSLAIADGLVKDQSVEQIALMLSITPRGVNKTIATNHIRDAVDAIFVLTDEIEQQLIISSGEERL